MIVLSYEKNFIAKVKNFFKWIIIEVKGIRPIYVETEQDYYDNQGCKYFDRHKFEKALEYYKKMIEHDPDDFFGYQRVADVYLMTGPEEEALKYFNLALEKAKVFKNKNNRNKDVKTHIADIEEMIAVLSEPPEKKDSTPD